MSGITGYFGKKEASQEVEQMIEMIKHRGVGDPVVKDAPKGAIGFVGQGEKNISVESLPFVIMDGMLIKGDKKDIPDAEYLRELYLEYGKEVFSKIKGSFACAIMDENECFIARDHVGARPVIYHESPEGEFMFASEGKALKELTNDVEELLPGHYYSTKEGLKAFDKCPVSIPAWNTTIEAISAVREVMIDAVKESLSNGKIEGVALSGGLDSSLILAVAHKYNKNIKAFTGTLAGHHGEDLKYAKMLTEQLGVEHHIYEITRDDIRDVIPDAVWYLESFDEDCIVGFIANYYTARMASEHVDSVLVGEGADELFGGYFRELKDIPDIDEKERIGRKLLEVAYNTALRRLDRGWMSNGVEYHAPFLHPAVVEICNRLPMGLKCFAEAGCEPIEKWILREAFRDMLPQEIADRPKMRFSRGVGIDDQVYKAIPKSIGEEDLEETPESKDGISLESTKELYYYTFFQRFFPVGYEGLTCRWDPFK